DGSLAALDEGLRRDARRTERRGGWNAFERVSVREIFSAPATSNFVVLLRGDVVNRGEQVFLIQIRPIVIFQRKQETAAKVPATAGALAHNRGSRLFLQTDARQPVPFAARAILARVLINLVWVCPVDCDGQARTGSLKSVIGLGPGSRAKLLLMVPFRNHIVIKDRGGLKIASRGFLTRT